MYITPKEYSYVFQLISGAFFFFFLIHTCLFLKVYYNLDILKHNTFVITQHNYFVK